MNPPRAAVHPPIPFFRPDCSGNELQYVREVIESGWLTTGRKALEFEQRLALELGARHVLALSSCTAALHLALEATGLTRGQRVIVPSLTFTATAEVIRYLGAVPHFVDVESGSCLMTADTIEQAKLECPSATHVIVVHFGGQVGHMPEIVETCSRLGLVLVEDCAHAFPASEGGRSAGTFGAAGCFSFYANKTLNTGEGGALVTNDERIAERVRLTRLHGLTRAAWDRTDPGKGWEYDVVAPGFKYNMADLNAALGLAQLERVRRMRDERQAIVAVYRSRLASVPWLELPTCLGQPEEHAHHLFWIVLKPECRVARNELIAQLAGRGIGTSVHYKPLHRLSYYASEYRPDPARFPNSDRHALNCISLPLFNTMTPAMVQTVCDALIEIGGSA